MKQLLAKARKLYQAEQYQRAAVLAKAVLALKRDNDEALFYLAHGLYYAKQYRRSLKYWRQLLQLCPGEPCVNLNMGACYEDLGKHAQAIKCYKRELEYNPVSGHALFNLGALYYRSRRYKMASAYLERCFSQKHAMDACVAKLAHAYFKTGQLEKEQRLYEDWLLAHPDDTWALNNLGSHLMGQGEYHRAMLRLKRAALIDPQDELVQKNIRKVRRILKKADKIT
jgi:tetratricopeptide (TPR) repeat protein